jgi:hypothetical protein
MIIACGKMNGSAGARQRRGRGCPWERDEESAAAEGMKRIDDRNSLDWLILAASTPWGIKKIPRNPYANRSVFCKGTRGPPRRVEGASITSSPITAEQAGRVDGDAEQFGIDGPP